MHKKEWTLLFYLEGNNELGIEMENTFLKIINSEPLEINIAIQISKARESTIQIIRQKEYHYIDNWIGVRRYSLINGKLKLESAVKQLNMADYKALSSFIEWGMNNFPAKKYALILSGHGFILDIMTDLENSKPFTMGIYEMCTAINNTKKLLNKVIDILILDMCSMNSIETLYELGKSNKNAVKYILTYAISGPLEGLNYNEFLNFFDVLSTESILKRIVNSSHQKLVAFKIDHAKLAKIKNICSEMCRIKLESSSENFNTSLLSERYTDSLNKTIDKLIFYYSPNCSDNSIIKILFKEFYDARKINFPKLINSYFKLSFCHNSYCLKLISEDIALNNQLLTNVNPEQRLLTNSDLFLIIKSYNGSLCDDSIEKLVINLYINNNWL